MGLSDEFISQHNENVIEFLSKNGGDIAHTYFYELENDAHKESLKRIIKAVLMDAFGTLKYYADDLHKEIDYPVSGEQKSVWMENTELEGRYGIVVRECDDFYGTMLLGTIPQSTCLNYASGSYKECLLSGFDSNKKVLYAYSGDEVVGRAIIRLTKGRFEMPEEQTVATLSFVDVENVNHDGTAKKQTDEEQLIIFLERPFSSNVPGETAEYIQGLYAVLLTKKAETMGAMLVISTSYSQTVLDDFVRVKYNVYISRSKAGAQYLDSLDGSAKVSDEGGFRSNSFYIHKNALKQHPTR
jgi:hypothetical protein